MIYFAHRGASARCVQNTVPAFLLARQLGATCYELDVHLTQDRQLAVLHDYSLREVAGKEVEIGHLLQTDLQKYPLRNRFSKEAVFIPLLKDVLPVLEPDLQLLNIELKNDGNRYPGIEKKLLEELTENNPQLLSKTLFSSFDFDTLARIRELDKNARVGLLTRSFDVSKALYLGAESVHLNHTRFTEEMARICHENGLKIYLYTVNEKELAQCLQEAGADGIFTDCIEQFLTSNI